MKQDLTDWVSGLRTSKNDTTNTGSKTRSSVSDNDQTKTNEPGVDPKLDLAVKPVDKSESESDTMDLGLLRLPLNSDVNSDGIETQPVNPITSIVPSEPTAPAILLAQIPQQAKLASDSTRTNTNQADTLDMLIVPVAPGTSDAQDELQEKVNSATFESPIDLLRGTLTTSQNKEPRVSDAVSISDNANDLTSSDVITPESVLFAIPPDEMRVQDRTSESHIADIDNADATIAEEEIETEEIEDEASDIDESESHVMPPIPEGSEVVPMLAGNLEPEIELEPEDLDESFDSMPEISPTNRETGNNIKSRPEVFVPMRTPEQLALQRAKVTVLDFESEIAPNTGENQQAKAALNTEDNKHEVVPDTVADNNSDDNEPADLASDVSADMENMSSDNEQAVGEQSTSTADTTNTRPLGPSWKSLEANPESLPELPPFPPRVPENQSSVNETMTPEEYAKDRDAIFAQRLHQVILTRKARAVERKAQEKQQNAAKNSKARAVALCLFMILVLTVTWLALRFVQHNSIVISGETIGTQAAELYQQGRYDEAADAYQNAVDEYPESPNLLMGLARSASRSGRPQTSTLAWDMYLKVIPKDDNANRSQALYERSLVRLDMGDTDGAVENLYQSLQYVSTNYDACITLGRLLERQNYHKPALQSYRNALELRPSSDEALEALNRVQRALQMSQAAQAASNTGVVFDSNSSSNAILPVEIEQVKTGLEAGTNALNNGRYDEAIAYFRDLQDNADTSSFVSKDIRIWLGIAGAWLGKGDLDSARAILSDPHVVELGSGDPTFDTLLATLNLESNMPVVSGFNMDSVDVQPEQAKPNESILPPVNFSQLQLQLQQEESVSQDMKANMVSGDDF